MAPTVTVHTVPEFAPERLDVDDADAIRASLDVHGYVRLYLFPPVRLRP